MEKKAFKIRKKDFGSYYSHGVINTHYDSATKIRTPFVKWSSKGKEWTSEKNVKDHLLKFIQLGGTVDDWEVIEVIYHPTRPIEDWIDDKMLMKVLKNQ
jgi:hypothetical protein